MTTCRNEKLHINSGFAGLGYSAYYEVGLPPAGSAFPFGLCLK